MDKLKRVLSGNDATPEESDGILPYVSTPRYFVTWLAFFAFPFLMKCNVVQCSIMYNNRSEFSALIWL